MISQRDGFGLRGGVPGNMPLPGETEAGVASRGLNAHGNVAEKVASGLAVTRKLCGVRCGFTREQHAVSIKNQSRNDGNDRQNM